MSNSYVLEFTNDNFEEKVINSDIPVLVDFWATWCGPYRMITPVIDEVAKDFEGKIKVGKINVDTEPAIAARYNIRTIPTIIFFSGGEIVNTQIGFKTKEEFVDIINKLI